MIKFHELDLNYGGKTVFRDFSLEIKKRQKVVLAGKSGLGKSTLFHLLLGFERPSRGDVFFNGIRVEERTVWDVRKEISFVDQDLSLGYGRVSSLLDYAAGLKANFGADFSRERLEKFFDIFELGNDMLNNNIDQLSGGERQRIALAVALLLGRKVFLLDEATSSLDSHLKKKTADYFLNSKELTVMAVTHDDVWLKNPRVQIFDVERKQWKR